VGSCIQCSVKTCKVAYHVTCAFKRGLEMRAIIEDENADDGVKLRVRRDGQVFAALSLSENATAATAAAAAAAATAATATLQA
jgi:PHD-like zinc-binding domain